MIVFFPTYARRSPAGTNWQATVAGMVTRPLPPRSRRRVFSLAVLRRLLDLDDAQFDSEVFRRRAEAFLFERIAGQPIRVEIGGRLIDAGRTDRTGHFSATVELDEATVAAAGEVGGWIPYSGWPVQDRLQVEDVLAAPEGPAAGGRIQMIAEQGLSVISDIDDTVKVTNVANRRELLANTFIREFQAVPGMVELYRRWQDRGVAFHYVSASPWQMADCLRIFLADVGLPAGSMHLKLFRLKDSTPLGRLPSKKRSKRRAIEQIMDAFPGRRFLLVGDSGELDPEIYASVARRRPHQIAGVRIRQVEGRAPRTKVQSRLERLSRRLPAGMLQSFVHVDDLADAV
jgi:phosphatidate phosphatase APP1